jgi:preprotein translocase SecE subunit
MEFVTKNLGQILLSVGAVAFLFMLVKYWQRIRKFLTEVITELSKVSWSTREELLGATWIVIVTTSMLALFIGTADFALSKFLRLILR